VATIHASPFAHRILLAAAAAAWVVGAGGYFVANALVSDVRAPLTVMSPRTFTAIALLWAGWWLSVATLALAVLTLAISHKSRTLLFAVLVGAAYALPLAVVLLARSYADG